MIIGIQNVVTKLASVVEKHTLQSNKQSFFIRLSWFVFWRSFYLFLTLGVGYELDSYILAFFGGRVRTVPQFLVGDGGVSPKA